MKIRNNTRDQRQAWEISMTTSAKRGKRAWPSRDWFGFCVCEIVEQRPGGSEYFKLITKEKRKAE